MKTDGALCLKLYGKDSNIRLLVSSYNKNKHFSSRLILWNFSMSSNIFEHNNVLHSNSSYT